MVGRAIILEREPSKKKQRTDIKKAAKRIKSDNFTRSIKKSPYYFRNIGKMIGWHHNYFIYIIQ